MRKYAFLVAGAVAVLAAPSSASADYTCQNGDSIPGPAYTGTGYDNASGTAAGVCVDPQDGRG